MEYTIKNMNDISKRRERILETVGKTIKKLRELIEANAAIDVFYALKFNKIGYCPINDEDLPQNFTEQLNQCFSDLVVLRGSERLLERYPERSFIIRLGTSGGSDIVSEDGDIIAECFASTAVKNNNKFASDIQKLIKNGTSNQKFLFFYSERDTDQQLEKICGRYPEINCIRIGNLF